MTKEELERQYQSIIKPKLMGAAIPAEQYEGIFIMLSDWEDNVSNEGLTDTFGENVTEMWRLCVIAFQNTVSKILEDLQNDKWNFESFRGQCYLITTLEGALMGCESRINPACYNAFYQILVNAVDAIIRIMSEMLGEIDTSLSQHESDSESNRELLLKDYNKLLGVDTIVNDLGGDQLLHKFEILLPKIQELVEKLKKIIKKYLDKIVSESHQDHNSCKAIHKIAEWEVFNVTGDFKVIFDEAYLKCVNFTLNFDYVITDTKKSTTTADQAAANSRLFGPKMIALLGRFAKTPAGKTTEVKDTQNTFHFSVTNVLFSSVQSNIKEKSFVLTGSAKLVSEVKISVNEASLNQMGYSISPPDTEMKFTLLFQCKNETNEFSTMKLSATYTTPNKNIVAAWFNTYQGIIPGIKSDYNVDVEKLKKDGKDKINNVEDVSDRITINNIGIIASVSKNLFDSALGVADDLSAGRTVTVDYGELEITNSTPYAKKEVKYNSKDDYKATVLGGTITSNTNQVVESTLKLEIEYAPTP
jgi:hypothetical protein